MMTDKAQLAFRFSALSALCLAVACGNDETASSDAVPVRGEPIQVAEVRGEPIAKPEAEAVDAVASAANETKDDAVESAEKIVATGGEKVEAERKATAPGGVSIGSDEELIAAAKATLSEVEKTAIDASAEVVKQAEAEARLQEPAGVAVEKPQAKVAATDVAPAGPAPAAVTTVAAKPEPKEAVVAAEVDVPVIKSGDQEYHQVGFDHLSSFEYEMPDEFGEVDAAGDASADEEGPAQGEATVAAGPSAAPEEKDQIPASVRKFNNKRVALEGFMLPLKVEDSLVTEMLIMRDQSMCCFGSVPKINEWVSIRMTGKGVKPVMDEPVTIYGKLKVGEIRENGYLVGIYEMDGERMGSRIDL